MTLYFQCNISDCLLIVADESYTQINKHVCADYSYAGMFNLLIYSFCGVIAKTDVLYM